MKILIIGGDAAGMSAAMQIRRRQPDWRVTVLERGEHTSYAACGIPYFLAGDVSDMESLIVVSPEAFRSKRGVDVRTGCEAVAIEVERQRVSYRTPSAEVETATYDRLLIATGASAVRPSWPGIDLEGVVPVRDLRDAARLRGLIEAGASRCVVVGAGYIGLEMAEALRRRGLEVTVVEKLDGVMGGSQPEVTRRVEQELGRHGAELRLTTAVEGFEGQDGRLRAVVTDHGPVPADIAVIGLGVRPNVALAESAEIPLGASGAIRVDSRQRTAAPEVFAAGDCCEAHHLVLGRPAYLPLALTANRQGRVAGAAMAGDDAHFPGIVGSAVTRTFDLTLARTGIDEAVARSEKLAIRTTEVQAASKAHYFPGSEPLWVKLIFRADNHKLLGAWLVGRDPSAGKRADVVATALSAGMSVQQLAELDLSYAPPFSPVWDPLLQAANNAVFELAAESRSTD